MLALPDGKVDVILSAMPAEMFKRAKHCYPWSIKFLKNERTWWGIADDQKT